MAAACVALAALAWGVAVLPHYGVTFDSPSLYYTGDRSLFFLRHPGAPFALDFMAAIEPPGFRSDFVLSPEISDPVHLPPLPGLVCAITSALFHERLRWLNFIDGHQLGLVLMHVVALYLFVSYGARVIGLRAAVFAGVFLAAFPCALGHSFNNAKDWPSAVFYAVTVLAAGAGILEERPRTVVAAGFWLGVALSAKFNPVFAVVTVFAWAAIVYRVRFKGRKRIPDRLALAVLGFPVLGGVLFFLGWPFLYHGPARDWVLNLVEYLVYMLGHGVSPTKTPSLYPFKCFVFMTPPLVLACALLFLFRGFRGSPTRFLAWALLVIWTLLPIVRVSLPGAGFYDANRHFIEYVPGLCAMAGAGASLCVDAVRDRFASPWTRGALLSGGAILAAVCLGWPIAEYHPFETLYFNSLVGGLGGAQRRGLLHADPPLQRANGSEADYWYTSLRAGLTAMRALARPGESLSACGPWPGQVMANWPYPERLPYVGDERGHIGEATLSADILYASPREGSCDWQRVRGFERSRRVLARVTRGGGLVYEIFGRPDGSLHPAISPPNLYDSSMP